MTTTRKIHAAHWARKGKGKAATWHVATEGNSAVPGDRFKATSSAGVITTGVLGEYLGTNAKGLHLFDFVSDPKTPEQRAADRALKAQHQAAYWASDRGVATAQRISDRLSKTHEHEDENTTEATEATETGEDTTATTTVTISNMATMLADLIAKGVSPADAVETVNALKAMAEGQTTQATTKAKATTKATTKGTKVRTPAQLANDARLGAMAKARNATTTKATTQATKATTQGTKAKVADEDTTAKGPKRLCDTCDNVAPLANVKGTQLRVCPTCITADVDTLIKRADRMEVRRG